MTWIKRCETEPCSTCVDGINPNDFTKWGYVTKTPKSPQTAKMCGSKTGDPYLGMISNECECSHPPPKPPSYQGEKYVQYREDCGAGEKKPCAPCGFENCENSKNGKGKYKKCGYCKGLRNKYHYWWQRDWSKISEKQQMKCCVTSPSQPNRTEKCSPDFWAESPICENISKAQCSFLKGTWNSDCDNYMNLNLNQFTDESISRSISLFSHSLQNLITISPDNPLKNVPESQIQKMIKWCSDPRLKGVCSRYLPNICNSVTKKDIANDSKTNKGNLGKLCACYLQPNKYLLPGIVPVECDSTCSFVSKNGGVPIYSYDSKTNSMVPKVCEQDTCIMDDVTVEYINSTIDGKTTFEQICGNCKGGNCTCVMNNVNESAINSIVKGGVTIKQNCGSCSKWENNQPKSDGKCETPEKSESSNDGQKSCQKKKCKIIKIIIGIFFIFVIAYFIFKFFKSS